MKKAIFLSFGMLVASVANAGVIDTTAAWNSAGQPAIAPFGQAGTATYGQTFTATAALGSKIDSFSFYLQNVASSNSAFVAYIAQWDGLKATGPMLYSSASNWIPTGQSGFTKFSFNTGGVSLTTGQQYVAFLSASGLGSNGNTSTSMGFVANPATYADGAFVFFNNSNFSQLTTTNWDNFLGNYGDAAFEASFSDRTAAVSAPGSLSLFGFAALMLAGGIRLRQRQQR